MFLFATLENSETERDTILFLDLILCLRWFSSDREHLCICSPKWYRCGAGEFNQASGLVIAVDIERSLKVATSTKTPAELYRNENVNQDTTNLNSLLGSIPMFADELPLVEQAIVIEKSSIVHPEIAGRGVEYAHGRAAYFYSSRCQGHLSELEILVHRAYSTQNIPHELAAAKFERRCNDYQRCYRMGDGSTFQRARKNASWNQNTMKHEGLCISRQIYKLFCCRWWCRWWYRCPYFNCKALSKILPNFAAETDCIQLSQL